MKASENFKAVLGIAVFVLILFNGTLTTNVFAKQSKASWTFMVYLDADNNLDMFGPFNLQQISEGLASEVNVKVVVLMDRLNLPAYVYEVTHDETKTVESLGEVDMGSPETLAWFTIYAMQNYPAEHFFLDLWDHGGGYKGVCWDDSSGNHLSPHDIESALATAEQEVERRVEIVGFDACLMGMIEVCYELKDVTDIVIGSEILVPGYGWPYTELMTYLSANPNIEPDILSEELVAEYIDFYESFKTTYIVQLSAINESCIPAFTESLNGFADHLREHIEDYKEIIAGARGASQQKFILGTMGFYFYIDLYKFASLVEKRSRDTDVKALSASLMKEIDTMVFAEEHATPQGKLDKKQFGLTVNFPPNMQVYNPKYESYVSCFVSETTWLQFLMTYYQAI